MSEEHDHVTDFEGFALEDLKKNFKALAKELEGTDNLTLNMEEQPSKSTKPPYFRGYDPNVYDFLARATTVEECEEIIEYCLHKGDIEQAEADHLLTRLYEDGPASFGTRKPGYYDQRL